MKKDAWRACVLGLLFAFVFGTQTLAAARLTTSSIQTSRSDIAGNYDVTGTNESSAAYTGELRVLKQGSVYQFRWMAGSQYDGIGIINGDTIAVAFTDGGDGTGCGVVSYRVLANGTLDGIWGSWGVNQSGTEIAKRTSGAGLPGFYNVAGTNPNGSAYNATLSIKSEGSGYEFHWSNGSSGFGVKQRNTLSVGFGGTKCAWVAYEIRPNGVLDGIWGSYGSSSRGTEKAMKRR